MIRAEPCGRCGGQICEERDEYRQIERYCLQCGARSYLDHRGEPVGVLTIEEERELMRLFSSGRGERPTAPRPAENRKLASARAQLRLLDA